ncbi:MAG: hypothetical protein OXO50_09415 [Caldilineaceae bacterium]|nr:hypothetical protein [Caldilineaceae bacterium]
MNLPAVDIAFLNERGIGHDIAVESGMTCIVIPQWPLPLGFDQTKADLLVRLTPGYPDVPPDMWWFDPPVRRADGQELPATSVVEHYLGRTWQRWSRHFSGAQWKSGVDCLESYLALIRQELERGVNGAR